MFDRLRELLNFSLFLENLGYILPGLLYNFLVFLGAAGLALTFGLTIALARNNRSWPLRAFGTIYTETFRNAPEYVLVLWVHYVVPVLLSQMLTTTLKFPSVFSAILALGLASSGYFAETFRAGIQAIPRGHVEAALSLGISRAQTMRRIVLPQAVRLMLPEGLNNLVSLFKATTLVSLISVPDLLYKIQVVNQYEMKPLPLYTGAAIIYFLLIFLLSSLARLASERWRARSRA